MWWIIVGRLCQTPAHFSPSFLSCTWERRLGDRSFASLPLGGIAFLPRLPYAPAVSLTEIMTAVEALSPDELTELAAFIRERDNAAWDRQIDSDFSEGGRLSSVAEEVRADIRAGRFQGLP